MSDGRTLARRMLLSHDRLNPVGNPPQDFKNFLAKDRNNGQELVEISGVHID
jgi:hypothetical protein